MGDVALFADAVREVCGVGEDERYFVRGLSCVMQPRASFQGEVATMVLRPKKKDEAVEGIYKSMEVYTRDLKDKCLVIDSQKSNRAFFGSLNGRMAQQAGVAGVIVNGATRDAAAVADLGMPVFSRTLCGADCYGHLVLDAINAPFEMDGVRVCPGDYLVADSEGCIILPASIAPQVRAKASEIQSRETKIDARLADGSNSLDKFNAIRTEFGNF